MGKDFVNTIKQIRNTQKVSLFEALVIYAQNLPDWEKYDGPYATSVKDTIRERKKAEKDNVARINKIKELTSQGYSLKEALEICKGSSR